MKTLFVSLLAARALTASFSYDLSHEIAKPGENWVYSPFSISACLTMAAAGSNGETAQKFKSVLGLSDEIDYGFEAKLDAFEHEPGSKTDFQMRIAQGVWIKDDFSVLPGFSSLMTRSFRALAERVPFSPATAARVNGWIAAMTKDKIQNLLSNDDLNGDSRLVLANALYFQGSWIHPFPSHNTRKGSFHLSDARDTEADFMNAKARFPYFENAHVQAVALPFESGSSFKPACALLLLKEGQDWNEAIVEEALNSLHSEKVSVTAPKFTLEQKIDLNPALKKLGLDIAFSRNADFSKIAPDLCLSKVLTKTFFAFEENGVEAAAATAAVINVTTSLEPRPERIFHFTADRPFYFVLFDLKTKTPFFIGKVENPRVL